jgi:hypothetical protein
MKKNLPHVHLPKGEIYHVKCSEETYGHLAQKCGYCEHSHPFNPADSTVNTSVGYRETSGNFTKLVVSEQTGEIVFAFGTVLQKAEA